MKLCLWLLAASLAAQDVRWAHLSSVSGDLPNPGGSTQQTGVLTADLDRDGASDFVITYRVHAPALVWLRRTGKTWTRSVIENEFLPIEAGGAAYDIDRDGDLDIVFGADSKGNQLWWWENPYPRFDPGVSWQRHTIKTSGANQHHDQIFADLLHAGTPQLIFWNQRAKSLLLAPIPANPKQVTTWPTQVIFQGQAGEGVDKAALYAEGLDAVDVDGDGQIDLLAGNQWFRYSEGRFTPTRIGAIGGRIKAGKFIAGKQSQVVIAPGDGNGPLMFYQATGDPTNPANWQGRDLLGQDMIHGHTLETGDINGDGHLDIFAAEMAKWSSKALPDHPQAKSWILYGDGKGGFRKTIFTTGHGWHEGRLADLDGDGDLDILGKPYTWNAPRVDIWLNNGATQR